MSEKFTIKGENIARTTNPVMKYGIAAIFATIGVSGSVRLIVSPSSSSESLVVLISISLFGLLLMFFRDQVDWFDLKNLKVKMRKIEEAKKSVEARERRVTAIAGIQSEITEKIISRHRLLLGGDVAAADKQWLSEKNSELKALTDNGPMA